MGASIGRPNSALAYQAAHSYALNGHFRTLPTPVLYSTKVGLAVRGISKGTQLRRQVPTGVTLSSLG
jgi:hypothetical protein